MLSARFVAADDADQVVAVLRPGLGVADVRPVRDGRPRCCCRRRRHSGVVVGLRHPDHRREVVVSVRHHVRRGGDQAHAIEVRESQKTYS